MANVFDTLAQSNEGNIADLFLDNIEAIYEYDATEIQDSLMSIQGDEDERKGKLIQIRQALFDKLCDNMPIFNNREMFNRRKMEMIALDAYVLGNSVVNNASDKRLSKVLKPPRGAMPSQSADDSVMGGHLVDNSDLLEACTELKTTVVPLTQTVRNLTKQVSDLQREINVLKEMKSNTAVPVPPPVPPQVVMKIQVVMMMMLMDMIIEIMATTLVEHIMISYPVHQI